MSKAKPIHSNGQSSVIPRIERLLTEQTSVILQAVDEKLSAQDKRIEQGFAAQDKQIEQGFAAQDKRMEERFVAQEIRILAAMDKRLEKMEERFANDDHPQPFSGTCYPVPHRPCDRRGNEDRQSRRK